MNPITPDRTPDAIERFKKLASISAQQVKHNEERVLDPTVVSKLGAQKINDASLARSAETAATKPQQSNVKGNQAKVLVKETSKERSRVEFER